MPYLIDAHEDIAYNFLTFNRDYRRPVSETRQIEDGTAVIPATGQSVLGWDAYQQGQVALIFATIFVMPKRYKSGKFENQDFSSPAEATRKMHAQVDYYQRLCDESPDMFALVRSKTDLKQVLAPWQAAEPGPHPVGLVLSIEGAEGIGAMADLEEWQDLGVRFLGPVWAGTRFCAGTFEGDRFTKEGVALLETLAGLGYTLDIAHMAEVSALEALDRYPGTIIASHANASGLIGGERAQRRHLSDQVIRRLGERDGVIGVLPYNRFIVPQWKNTDPREDVPLSKLVDHIDHICQLTGSVRHVAVGTDFDGGFGWPAVPLEINTIADLQKLVPILEQRGFSSADTDAVFHGNWLKILEKTLPA